MCPTFPWQIAPEGQMSKQQDDVRRSAMDTYPSVGRFSIDHKVSLHTKGSSAKFSDFERLKSMGAPRTVPAPPSSRHQPSPEPRPATDIVDLRTSATHLRKVRSIPANKKLTVT